MRVTIYSGAVFLRNKFAYVSVSSTLAQVCRVMCVCLRNKFRYVRSAFYTTRVNWCTHTHTRKKIIPVTGEGRLLIEGSPSQLFKVQIRDNLSTLPKSLCVNFITFRGHIGGPRDGPNSSGWKSTFTTLESRGQNSYFFLLPFAYEVTHDLPRFVSKVVCVQHLSI